MGFEACSGQPGRVIGRVRPAHYLVPALRGAYSGSHLGGNAIFF